jgi:hypothetical protein
MTKHICTIIAKNYISFARTLCSSFIEHHQDSKCYVLIIDDYESYIHEEQENFEIINIKSLGIKKLESFCYKYNITELATAFKPYLLRYLLETKGLESILYLDPDILVAHPLTNLYNELKHNDIIITPHLDKDYPDDGLMPDDSHIMRSGIYNLGFIGIRNCDNTNRFLEWWQGKLYNKCVIETGAGYFVDQKFIDLAFVLFSNIKIIYDTGYNAAYWNAHSRCIHKQGNSWMCNEGILYFYHFSNYKPDKPDTMSGHQNRFNLKDLTGLHELFTKYTVLLKQNGYETTKQWPYDYMCYSNGRIIEDTDRIAYRKDTSSLEVDNPFNWESHSIDFRNRVVKRYMKQKVKFHRRRLKKKFLSFFSNAFKSKE